MPSETDGSLSVDCTVCVLSLQVLEVKLCCYKELLKLHLNWKSKSLHPWHWSRVPMPVFSHSGSCCNMKPSSDCSSSKCHSQLPELHYFLVKRGKTQEFRQVEQLLCSDWKSKVKRGPIFPATEMCLLSSFILAQEAVKCNSQFTKLLQHNQGLKRSLRYALWLIRRYISSSFVLQNQVVVRPHVYTPVYSAGHTSCFKTRHVRG